MSWAKIDDRFHSHPKLAQLGPLLLPCVGLHVLALSWCAQYLTDGVIPIGQVRKLAGRVPRAHRGNTVTTLVEKLVEVGLWEELPRANAALSERSNRALWALKIHDYLHYNPSRATVLEERKRTAQRVAKHRGARAALAIGNGVGNTYPVPVPVLPSEVLKEDPLYSPKVQNLDLNQNGDETTTEIAEAVGGDVAEQLVPDELRDANEVLQFLNAKTGRTYGGLANLQLIDARLREGWSVQDCRTMVMRKWREWRDDPKMAPYARPSTLFNRGKLETYMGELGFTRS